MGLWTHRLSEIDEVNKSSLCSFCGLTKIKKVGKHKNGKIHWRCVKAEKRIYKKKDRRKSVYERCGFKPEHKCQLDLDHIDGNHNNNHFSNCQTLCANCHRLKTFQNRDWDKSTHKLVAQ